MNAIRAQAKADRELILTAERKPNRSIVMPHNICPLLKEQPRWLMWRWFQKHGRWTKRPYQIEGLPASATRTEHWSDFEDAWQAFLTNDYFDGIGFALGDGFVGVDLDCCHDGEKPDPEASRVIKRLRTYAEVSPTRTGVKAICRGKKPPGWRDSDEVEIKDSGYFTITGMLLEESAEEIGPLRDFNDTPPPTSAQASDRIDWAKRAMQKIPVPEDEKDGSARIVRYARQAVRCGLDDGQAIDVIRQMLASHPTPRDWTDDEIIARLADAAKRRGDEVVSNRFDLQSLKRTFPERRPELIEGLVRRGEVANIIGAPKQGKSWLVYGLAVSVAAGVPWMGHDVHGGKVLLLDNELHPSELAFRLNRVLGSLVIDEADLAGKFLIEAMRGHRPDIASVDRLLEEHYTGEDLSLIVLDAYYRLLPPGVSENDNSAVTQIFNTLDRIANRHNCSIVLIHHASKGEQGHKAITDVGAGAGAITRAADTHLIVRPHEDDDCAVLEGVCRSHVQPEAKTIRFDFPVWRLDESTAPEVKLPKSEAERKQEQRDREADEKVLKVLREEVEANKRTIRDKTGMSPDRTNRAVVRLLDRDQIQITKEVKVRGQLTEMYAILESIDRCF